MLFHRRGRHLRAGRTRRLAALAVAVLAAHGVLLSLPEPVRWGEGAGAEAALQRFEVDFVSELRPTAAPAAPAQVPPAAAPPRWTAPRAPAEASAAASATAAAAPAPALAAAASAPASAASVSVVATAASAPAAVASVAASAASASGALAVFAAASAPTAPAAPAAPAMADAAAVAADWPPSTRLSYHLTGQARGPVEGQARVEWRRQGTRYLVVMEASIGPSFAPLMTRRESSEGEITADGLHPHHYEMEMKVLLRAPRRTRIEMAGELVRLPTGAVLQRPPGLQDAVSQFVQMTWLFTRQPALLSPGQALELPLALPRRVEPWVYDIVGSETLHTSAGALEAVHVRPRRAAREGDYTAEMWVAPSLQNLPVRIVVRQDSEHWIDLALERLPQQAAQGQAPTR